MKSILPIIAILAILPLAFSLVCQNTQDLVKDETEADRCTSYDNVIYKCIYQASSDLSKCHTCFTGASTTGTTNLYDSCICPGETNLEGIDENLKKACVKDIPNCLYWNSSDTSKCHTCIAGATPQGSTPNLHDGCDCTGKDHKVVDSEGKEMCISAIVTDCGYYTNDASGNCAQCRIGATPTGSEGNYTGCDCTGKDYKEGVDSNGHTICAAQEIQNCLKYSSTDSTKCAECKLGYLAVGTSPEITECTCDMPRQLQEVFRRGILCVPEDIPDCKVYNPEDLTKCHSCQPGYTGLLGESSPSLSECTCAEGKQVTLTQSYQRVCGITMPGCRYRNSENVDKCHTCYTGFDPVGGEENKYDSCSCAEGKFIKMDLEMAHICVPTNIPGCSKYNNVDPFQCHTCGPKHTEVGESPAITACNCDTSTNKVLKDASNHDYCVPNDQVIDNCSLYNSQYMFAKCHQCNPGFTLQDDGSCECPSSTHFIKTDENDQNVCVETDIAGCQNYNSENLSKCHTCYDAFSPQGGSENLYEQCTCSNPALFPVMDESNTMICGERIIENCEKVNSSDTTLCHTCLSPYEGNGSQANKHSECGCPTDTSPVETNTDATVCGKEIENCDKNSNSDPTKCYTCKAPFQGIEGESLLYTKCGCPPDQQMLQNQYDRYHCGQEIPYCQTYLQSNPEKCYSCRQSTIPQGDENSYTSCIPCLAPKKIKQDNQGNLICAEEIHGCLSYLDVDNARCHTCSPALQGVGTENEYTSCGCQESEHRAKNQNDEYICAPQEIPNCLQYNQSDLSKCYQCNEETVPIGISENSYTECQQCNQEVLQDETGSYVCTTAISGCRRYNSSTPSKCHECYSDLTGEGSDNLFTACNCPSSQQPVKNDSGDTVCIQAEIENCIRYASSASLTPKCYECMEGTGVGSYGNYSSCPCESPMVFTDKVDGTKICASVMEFCNVYLSPTTCDECAFGFLKDAILNDSCMCDQDKKKQDGDGNDICVPLVIDKCVKYETLVDCGECEAGSKLSDDKKTCQVESEDPLPPASGGGLISFGYLIIVVFFAFVL